MLKPGQRAPDFTLLDHNAKEFRLSTQLSLGPLVLFFYPADFTPVCTAEACMFRDEHAQLADAGLHVVGISPQSAESHRRFRETHSLPYELLSDPHREVIAKYAGSIAGVPLPLLTRRVTYLIAQDATIKDRVVNAFSAESHRAIIAAARNLAKSPNAAPAQG